VRGLLTRSSDDRLQHTVDIAHHIVVPDAQNQIAVVFDIGRPLRVFKAALVMLPAIQFNDEMGELTAEIDNIGPDRHLSPKFHSVKTPVAQPKPQGPLGVGLIAP
jgi:hypothetical protein